MTKKIAQKFSLFVRSYRSRQFTFVELRNDGFEVGETDMKAGRRFRETGLTPGQGIFGSRRANDAQCVCVDAKTVSITLKRAEELPAGRLASAVKAVK